MELLTIVAGVLAGALLSNLPALRSLSERAIQSARMASMEARLPETAHAYGESKEKRPSS
jgi:hypothetical protein